MSALLTLLLLVPVSALITEDFKNRRVRIMWLAAFAGASVIAAIFYAGVAGALANLITNSILLLITGCGVAAWFVIRGTRRGGGKKLEMKSLIGSGDIVFLAVLTPLFGLREYLIFILTASIGSLAWWFAATSARRADVTIPFVGTAGIVFCIYMIIKAI